MVSGPTSRNPPRGRAYIQPKIYRPDGLLRKVWSAEGAFVTRITPVAPSSSLAVFAFLSRERSRFRTALIRARSGVTPDRATLLLAR